MVKEVPLDLCLYLLLENWLYYTLILTTVDIFSAYVSADFGLWSLSTFFFFFSFLDHKSLTIMYILSQKLLNNELIV